MKRKSFFCFIFSVLIFLFGFTNHSISQLKSGDPIIIGAPTFLGSIEGAESVKAATLAIEEINAKGGVSIKGVKHPLKIEASEIRDGAPGVPVPEALLGIEKTILEKKVHYYELGADHFDRLNLKYITNHLVNRLNCLGYKVIFGPLSLAG